MQEVYLQDILYEYLINRLIKNESIIIYKDNLIEIADKNV